MRTDVKIGIAVGLLVAVVAVIWFLFPHNKDNTPAASPSQADSRHHTIPPVATTRPEDSTGVVTPYHTVLGSSTGGTGAGDSHATTMPAGGLRGIPGSPGVSGTPAAVAAGGTSASPDVYVVKEHDTAWGIVTNVYGNAAKYMDAVKAANPGVDLGHLRIGQKLTLPKVAGATPTTMPVARSSSGRSTPVASGTSTSSRTAPTGTATPAHPRPIFD